MKFAIVSDSHDNVKNLNKIIEWLNKEGIGVLLHCGDIATEGTIQEAEKNFKGEIEFVRGNADFSVKDLPDSLSLDLGGKKVAIIHYPDLARKLAETGHYDLVFYGHTHKPWEEMISPSTGSGRACRLVNPGESAGHRYKPTFALYDTETDKLELKILERL